MTDAERAELKRLVENATKGPWFVGDWFGRCLIDHKHGGPECRFTYDNPAEGYRSEGTGISSREPGRTVVRSGYDGAEIDEADARFIAAANPAAVLDLLATLEDQRHVIAELERKLEIRKQWDVQAEACLEELARVVHLGHPEPIRTFPTDGAEFAHLVGAVTANVNGRSDYRAENERLKAEIRRLRFEMNGEE